MKSSNGEMLIGISPKCNGYSIHSISESALQEYTKSWNIQKIMSEVLQWASICWDFKTYFLLNFC